MLTRSLAGLLAVLILAAAGHCEPLPLVVLNGHQGVLVNAAFSADGRLLATEDYSNAIRVWDLRTRRGRRHPAL